MYKLTNCKKIFPVILFLFAFIACADNPTDRPEGWTEESHGPDADANYDVIFAQDEVKRIDLIIKPTDWQVMLDDMTELVGEFGSGYGGDGPPPELFEACEGLEAGDICVLGNGVEGTCTSIPIGLLCIPDMSEFCEGLEEGDTCIISRDGDEIEGTCTRQGPNLNCTPDSGIDVNPLARNPVYMPCTFYFEDKTWWHVGVRFKGQSSLQVSWLRGIYKLPIRFDFDEFEDDYPEIEDQRFYGFKKLTMSSGFSDNSLIREKVAADIFREAGVPSATTAFYQLFIDYGEGPVYFGLYTMVEAPDDPMLEVQFKDDGGNLYKAKGEGARLVEFDEESFDKKTNEDERDWSDVIAVFEALHANSENPPDWRSGLEDVFNVEGFLRWLAVNTVIQNWDTYGNMSQNYYLYGEPKEESGYLVHWIPWDNNMSLNSEIGLFPPLSLSLSEVDNQWPMIRYLIDDSHYQAVYLSMINEIINGPFSVDHIRERYQSAHNLISQYVVGDEGELPGYTLLNDPEDFYQELDYLFDHVEQRREAALDFLSQMDFDPSMIVINEILYNPSSDLDDEDYEFIELYNAGESTVDLSGYAFTEGIEFTFPQDTSISSGEYILIAKNADTYSGEGYQVFQWSSGNLSNGGEVIQLKDAEGIQIDFLIYDDESPWVIAPDGTGPSLELIDTSYGNSLPENWEASTVMGGTPGQSNSVSMGDLAKE